MSIKSLICTFLIFTCLGCSVYTFNPKGKSTISSMAVQLFENSTGEYGLEDRMTQQIIEAFIDEGSIKIVPEGSSEALLKGKLVGYDRQPFDPDETDQVSTYKITMSFEIQLINTADNTDIWNNRISQFGLYNLEEETEEDGQQRAITKLVDDILNLTTKSW